MQAVAWVCTRNIGAVWRADLEADYHSDLGLEAAFVDEYFPPGRGLTLLTLDAWDSMRHSGEPWAMPSDAGVTKLVDRLRAGQLPATGIDRNGGRVSIDSGDWRRLTLSSADDARELVPCRTQPRTGRVTRWSDILVCRDSLFADFMPLADATSPQNALTRSPPESVREAERKAEVTKALKIQRFVEKQLKVRHWISLADIADWCSRENGSIRPNGCLKAEAYRELAEGLVRGEFEVNGRTRMIFLGPAARWFKMTREKFKAWPRDMRDDRAGENDLKASCLEQCWIPRDVCLRWFEKRRLPPPSWIPGSEATPQTAVQRGYASTSIDNAAYRAESVSKSGVIESATTWIANHATLHIQSTGVPCKRDATLKLCMHETGCTYRVALRAWEKISQELKRSPRQTDRTLIGQRAPAAR